MKTLYDSSQPSASQHSQRKFYQRLLALITLTLMPVSVFANALQAFAIPQSATIADLKPESGSGVPAIRMDQKQRPAPASKNQTINLQFQNSIPRQSILVVGGQRSQVHVRFDHPADPLLQIGPGDSATEYLFPCAIHGAATIGWKAMNRNSRGCTSVIAKSGRGPSAMNLPKATGYQLGLASDKSLQAKNPAGSFQYCSVLEEAGSGWGFSDSTDGTTNPCQKAIEECKSNGVAGSCEVATLGEEPLETQELMAFVQCSGNIVFPAKGSGQSMVDSELKTLHQEARYINGKSCFINVYHPGDVAISPASDDVTLIQLQPLNSGSIEVSVLVGSVDIVSVDRQHSLRLQKGNKYQSGENIIKPIDCPKTLGSGSMQSFLNPALWAGAPGISSQLAEYKQKFCATGGSPERPTEPPTGINIPFPLPRPIHRGNDGRGNNGGGNNLLIPLR
ncbi:hypothetical protein [Stenomitos frigidus]|uniref:Uncharacterized protein n=1 Tax=Stenomitos frigidus ULC18 TaxID=2107698 RepID=A0A2T1DWB2_9CYAN|nr:hypothetical protein [Stenomitos frigidus]PSB24759.1 hypothetical protein C7B82_25445 [Stenomitos frigidus ULC18]